MNILEAKGGLVSFGSLFLLLRCEDFGNRQIGLHFVFCLYSAGLSFCVVALSLYTFLFPLGYFLNVGILATYN